MQSIRLIQFSDLHLFGDAAGQLRGVSSLPALQAAISDAHRRGLDPDAVLLTGDLVQDDPEGYRWVRQVFGSSRVPVLCLAGNHDLPDHMRAALSAPFSLGGATEFGRWVVVMLDTWTPNDAGGRIGAAQLADLRNILAAHQEQHVLVCLHHHPIAMRSGWLDQVGLRDADEFMAVLREHSNVRGVLWGHVHLSRQLQRRHPLHGLAGDLRAVPAGQRKLRDRSPTAGLSCAELMPDGTIATEVCWLESYSEEL